MPSRLHHLLYALQAYSTLRPPPSLQHVAALIQLMLIERACDTTVHVDINVQILVEAEGKASIGRFTLVERVFYDPSSVSNATGRDVVQFQRTFDDRKALSKALWAFNSRVLSRRPGVIVDSSIEPSGPATLVWVEGH